MATISIGGTINIGNFENIKFEISDNIENAQQFFKLKEDAAMYLRMLGNSDETDTTKQAREKWIKRVLGNKI